MVQLKWVWWGFTQKTKLSEECLKNGTNKF